jgi:2-succinyl-6-hydroxy-2,4-cyclohexadiene-1-carboxylate synthase
VIIALHGFFGLPSDWGTFQNLRLEARDIWADAHLDLDEWTDRFLAGVGRDKPALLGYSMGGRLAMHAALRAPELFSAAIFVSANPGIAGEAEREKRLRQDLKWAERFRKDRWALLLQDWNKQAVLKSPSNFSFHRVERSFDRAALASAMDLWSLGRQKDLREGLAALPIPQLYLTGQSDTKFTALTKAFTKPESHRIIKKAGHRVPWDNPEDFEASVTDFLKDIN